MRQFIAGMVSMLVFGGVLINSAVLCAEEDEENIALSEVPEVVKNAALDAVEGIELFKAELEKKASGEIYELEGKVNGKVYEIKIKPDGTVIKKKIERGEKEEEEDVDIADVPDSIKDVAYRVLQGIELTKAELEKKAYGEVYELKGKLDDKVYEIKILTDGTLLKVELKGHGRKHDDD